MGKPGGSLGYPGERWKDTDEDDVWWSYGSQGPGYRTDYSDGIAVWSDGLPDDLQGGQAPIVPPWEGEVMVEMKGGCPQVSKKVVLKMIEEYEEKDRRMRKIEDQTGGERNWLADFILAHPVFRDLPEHLRKTLVETPAESLHGLPGSNRRRRRLLQEGFVVYLYAGEKEGYTLGRAMKEVGGDERRLLEIDVLREEHSSESHDMLKTGGVYSILLRAALDGLVKGIITSPNCRTRSVLRHYPLPHARRTETGKKLGGTVGKKWFDEGWEKDHWGGWHLDVEVVDDLHRQCRDQQDVLNRCGGEVGVRATSGSISLHAGGGLFLENIRMGSFEEDLRVDRADFQPIIVGWKSGEAYNVWWEPTTPITWRRMSSWQECGDRFIQRAFKVGAWICERGCEAASTSSLQRWVEDEET